MQNKEDQKIAELLSDRRTVDRGFKLLMDRFQEKLYWKARRLLGNHDDANDVLQNTLVKVYKNIDSFRGNSSLYTWMYTIITNECLSFLRKKKRMAKHISIENEEVLNTAGGVVYNDVPKTLQVLNEAMQSLPPKQRKVFELRYLDEMSYKEISALLGTSVGGLKASFHHAANKVEAYVKKTIL